MTTDSLPLIVLFHQDYNSAKNAMRELQASLLSDGVSYSTNSANMTLFVNDWFKIMYCVVQAPRDLERLCGLSIAAYEYADGFVPTKELHEYILSKIRPQPKRHKESN